MPPSRTSPFFSLIRGFNLPTLLTVLRLVLVPAFVLLLIASTTGPAGSVPAHLRHLNQRRHAALAVLALMAGTDFLDGFLARRLNQVTRLGTLLDPLADKLLVTTTLILLCFPARAPAGFAIPWCIPLGIWIKDIGVILGVITVRRWIGTVKIASTGTGRFSTLAQLLLILATVLSPELIRVSPTIAAGVLWSLWWLTILAATAGGMGYALEGSRQLRAARGTATAPSSKIPAAHS